MKFSWSYSVHCFSENEFKLFTKKEGENPPSFFLFLLQYSSLSSPPLQLNQARPQFVLYRRPNCLADPAQNWQGTPGDLEPNIEG